MSNLSINSLPGQPIGIPADSEGTTSVKPGTSGAAATTPPPADSVNLSAGAQAAVSAGTTTSKPPLSASDANKQSVQLRQQLGSAPLSGTARQNQAILALLR
jgi:hypothetical protein